MSGAENREIDDFPTLARLNPPEDVTYRRVPDESAIAEGDADATKVIAQIKDPVEGRKVTIFTYSAESVDISINYLRAQYATAFDAMINVLRQSLIRVEVAFMQTPWPVVAFLFLALSWAFAGAGITVFLGSSLAFLALFERWQIKFKSYGLDGLDGLWELNIVSADTFKVGLEAAYTSGKPQLFYDWTPEAIHVKYDLTVVEEPARREGCENVDLDAED